MRRRPAKKAVKAVTSVVSSVGGFFKDIPFFGEFTPLGMFTAATTLYSMIKERKSAKEQSKIEEERVAEQKRQEEIKARYNEVEARRARYQQLQKKQYAQGELETTIGVAGAGTSAIAGGIGSVQTQYAQNVGNINLAQGLGTDLSASNVRLGQLGSEQYAAGVEAQQYGRLANLSLNIFGRDSNIFKQGELPSGAPDGGYGGNSSRDNIFAPPTIA